MKRHHLFWFEMQFSFLHCSSLVLNHFTACFLSIFIHVSNLFHRVQGLCWAYLVGAPTKDITDCQHSKEEIEKLTMTDSTEIWVSRQSYIILTDSKELLSAPHSFVTFKSFLIGFHLNQTNFWQLDIMRVLTEKLKLQKSWIANWLQIWLIANNF